MPDHATTALMDAIDGGQSPGTFFGIRVVTNALLLEWEAHPRSPSRAKRRARLGHPQHRRQVPSRHAYMLGGHTMVMHPAMFDQLQDEQAARGLAR